MKITFIPQRNDAELVIEKQGDVLIINNEKLDFLPLPEGGTLPFGSVNNGYVISDVKRIDGCIELSILLPHEYIPNSDIFEPVIVVIEKDGIVELPNVN